MKRPPIIRFLLMICVAVLALGFVQTAHAQPSNEPIEKTAFVSPETVGVGCGAGLVAGAFAAALPAVWPLPGQPTLVTLPIVTAWGLIGCAVGVAAGLSAVVTQAVLDSSRM